MRRLSSGPRKSVSQTGWVAFLAIWVAVLVLSVAAGKADAREPSETRGPLTFDVRNLELRDFIGTVLVEPGETDEVVVVMTGDPEKLEEIELREGNNLLIVDGQKGRGALRDFRRWFDPRPVEGRLDNYPVVSIVVPEGGAVEIADMIGALRIGDTQGDVTLEGVSVDASVGRVATARVAVSGSGDVVMSTVTEDLDAAIAGSGSVKAEEIGGAVRVSIAGSGDVGVKTIGAGLSVSVSGSGEVIVGTVDGPVRVAINGSGDVTIGDGRADPLKVSINGSGDLHLGGTAVDPRIAVSGSGDVHIGQLEGELKSSGNGEISIGKR